jgi:hypothetical protein
MPVPVGSTRILAVSLAALVTSGLAGGCRSGEEQRSAAPGASTSERAASAWPGPPRPQEDGTIAVAGFNEYAERDDAAWTRSPLLVAVRFLGLESRQAAKASIDVETSPEGGDEASVTVTLDGLLDDSVRGVRTFLTLDRQAEGSWRLRSARQQQRCWPKRGHQGFSTARCV